MNERLLESIFFGIALALVAILVWALFEPYLVPLVIAATLAIVFQPLHRIILGSIKNYPGIAAFAAASLILLIILVPLSFIGLQVGQEVVDIFAKRESFAIPPAFAEILHRYGPPELSLGDVVSNLRSYAQSIAGWLLSNIQIIISGFSNIFAQVILALIALYYFLKDGEAIRHMVVRTLPITDEYVEDVFTRVTVAVNSVVRGSLVVALLQGTIAGIGFFIFGIPNPVFLGVIAVIASLLPIIGAGIVILPAIIYLAIIGQPMAALGLGVWGFFAVGLVDNFVRPQLMKRDVKIHPLFILLSVFGGLEFFGPIGFLLGPVVLSIFAELLELYPRIVLHRPPGQS